ncbi:MAG: SDR family NAD(P)-dependent oxidoreductase [Acidihalobacter sp.]
MNIQGQTAVVTGGGSGLGAATAWELAARGARVAVLDVNAEAAEAQAAEIGGLGCACDITDAAAVERTLERVREELGPVRVLMNVAGIGGARRVVGRDGSPMPLEDFRRVVEVNLVGTFNVIRLAAAAMAALEPLEDGERGVMVNTASVAAYDGQVGQEAYAASKGGLVSLTLPLARDSFSQASGQARGIRGPGRAHRRERRAQRRGHSPRRRAEDAATLRLRRNCEGRAQALPLLIRQLFGCRINRDALIE